MQDINNRGMEKIHGTSLYFMLNFAVNVKLL